MTEQAAPTVNGRVFEPPGRGPWELESTHASRPMTYLAQDAFRFGFVRGFKEGTARYGVLLSHLEPGFTHSFMYNQPVPVGAPPGAMKPPPKVVLQAVTRLHPEIRRRIQTGQRALRDKIWREDLANWDNVDKPDAIARHQAIQSVDVAGLSDAELADHVDRCVEHAIFSAYLHHKYTIPAIFPVGDFLAGAQEWTGATVGELLGPLRGQSGISRGFAADELDSAAKKLVLSPMPRRCSAARGPPRRSSPSWRRGRTSDQTSRPTLTLCVGAASGTTSATRPPASCPSAWSKRSGRRWLAARPVPTTTRGWQPSVRECPPSTSMTSTTGSPRCV